MPNFHYRVESVSKREAARHWTIRDVAEVRARRWSRTAGATVRCSNAAHDAREHVPPPFVFPCLGQRQIPRDKTKPGPCSLPSFIRGRGGGGGERFLRSVWTGPFIPPNFQPAPHRVYRRPTSSQPWTSPLPPRRLTVPDHHLEQTPSASTTEPPGVPGFLNILFTRHPASCSFASLSLVAPPFSLSLHLTYTPFSCFGSV